MPLPLQPDHTDQQHNDDAMKGDKWSVELNSYREVGLAIASFNVAIGFDKFVGTAEMIVEDGMRRIEITLYHDEMEQYRCTVCNVIPRRPDYNDPGICAFCGNKVCSQCAIAHEKGHWRPAKTIGGDILCDGDKIKCGQDQCPRCFGIPF